MLEGIYCNFIANMSINDQAISMIKRGKGGRGGGQGTIVW